MSDAKRASKDAIVGALADDLRRAGAEPAVQKIADYVVPILETADRQAECHLQSTGAEQTDDPVGTRIADAESRGAKWLEVDDVGTVTFHKDGYSFTADDALLKLAGLKGGKAEELRRRLWLKYLRKNHPALWQEFEAAAKADGHPEIPERRLNEVLERSRKLVPSNPWNPLDKKITVC
jgi:hypothetical protein